MTAKVNFVATFLWRLAEKLFKAAAQGDSTKR